MPENEIDDDVIDDPIEDDIAEPQYTNEELKAIDQGWNPDFDGPDKRSAREFLDRGSFFKKIEALNQSNKDLSKQVEFLVERNKEAAKIAYDQAIEDLKAKKLEALEENDHKTVLEIDDKIADTKAKKAAEEETPKPKQSDQLSPEYVQWLSNNKWYSSNKVLHAEADSIYQEFYASNPNATHSEGLEYVGETIKKNYPEYFRNKKREGAPPVEGSMPNNKQKKSTKKKYTAADMDESDRLIMKTMIEKKAVKSEDEYIEQLVATGYFS